MHGAPWGGVTKTSPIVLSPAAPTSHLTAFLHSPWVLDSGEQPDRAVCGAVRPLPSANNLPLGGGLAELLVLFFFISLLFFFPDFLTTVTPLLTQHKRCNSTEDGKTRRGPFSPRHAPGPDIHPPHASGAGRALGKRWFCCSRQRVASDQEPRFPSSSARRVEKQPRGKNRLAFQVLKQKPHLQTIPEAHPEMQTDSHDTEGPACARTSGNFCALETCLSPPLPALQEPESRAAAFPPWSTRGSLSSEDSEDAQTTASQGFALSWNRPHSSCLGLIRVGGSATPSY